MTIQVLSVSKHKNDTLSKNQLTFIKWYNTVHAVNYGEVFTPKQYMFALGLHSIAEQKKILRIIKEPLTYRVDRK